MENTRVKLINLINFECKKVSVNFEILNIKIFEEFLSTIKQIIN